MIDYHIEQYKNQIAAYCHENQQPHIDHVKERQHLGNQRESKGQMESRRYYRQEKHRQYLRIDALPYLPASHSHLLHNGKPGLIFIALRHLLVIVISTAASKKTIPRRTPRKNRPP